MQAGHGRRPAPAVCPLSRRICGPGGRRPRQEHQQTPPLSPTRAVAEGI